MKFKKLQRNRYYPIVLITVSVIVILTILRPTKNDIKELQINIIKEWQSLETAYQDSLNLKKSRTQLSIIKDEFTLLDESLLEKGEELNFITTLEKLASDQNLSHQLKLQEVKKENEEFSQLGYQEISFQITLTGDFKDIVKYIQGLEKQPFYLLINQVRFNNDTLQTLPLPTPPVKPANIPNQEGLKAIIQGITLWQKN